jgi:hypothetical protein
MTAGKPPIRSRTTSRLPRPDLSDVQDASDLSRWSRGRLRAACLREGIDHARATIDQMRRLLHARNPSAYPWASRS